MKCRCGGETSVLDSRLTSQNAIRRRRICDDCGKRITTYESTLDVHNLRAARAAAEKRRWQAKSLEERRAIKTREHTRAAARAEAKETGRPVAEIYKAWGCE